MKAFYLFLFFLLFSGCQTIEKKSQEAIKMRADAGLKILAYGWNAEKERVFTVAEMDDPQTVQKMMQTPEAAAIMAKAGTDKSSMEMIPLPNGKPGI